MPLTPEEQKELDNLRSTYDRAHDKNSPEAKRIKARVNKLSIKLRGKSRFKVNIVMPQIKEAETKGKAIRAQQGSKRSFNKKGQSCTVDGFLETPPPPPPPLHPHSGREEEEESNLNRSSSSSSTPPSTPNQEGPAQLSNNFVEYCRKYLGNNMLEEKILEIYNFYISLNSLEITGNHQFTVLNYVVGKFGEQEFTQNTGKNDIIQRINILLNAMFTKNLPPPTGSNPDRKIIRVAEDISFVVNTDYKNIMLMYEIDSRWWYLVLKFKDTECF